MNLHKDIKENFNENTIKILKEISFKVFLIEEIKENSEIKIDKDSLNFGEIIENLQNLLKVNIKENKEINFICSYTENFGFFENYILIRPDFIITEIN